MTGRRLKPNSRLTIVPPETDLSVKGGVFVCLKIGKKPQLLPADPIKFLQFAKKKGGGGRNRRASIPEIFSPVFFPRFSHLQLQKAAPQNMVSTIPGNILHVVNTFYSQENGPVVRFLWLGVYPHCGMDIANSLCCPG